MTPTPPTPARSQEETTTAPTYGKWEQHMLSASGTTMQAAEPVVLEALQARLDELLADIKPVCLLDAGCGKHRPVPISEDRYIVGVDISDSQLVDNAAINEAIVGDIHTCDLGHARFDAVLCWNVLEHLDRPREALINIKSALKPRGVIILGVPHALSVKGLVTRFTPFWFHNWVWRHMLGAEPDFEPFPTVMSFSIAPRRLRAFAKEQNFSVEFSSEYEGWEQKKLRDRYKVTGRMFQTVHTLIKVLSFGMITAKVTSAIIVLQKQGDA